MGRGVTVMKTKIYIGLVALIAGLLSTGCADRIEPTFLNDNGKEEPAVEKMMVFKATMEQNDADTKTSLDGTAVVWTEGDKIRVFNHSHQNGVVFTLKAGEGGKATAEFEGEYIGSGPYYAIYPASATESLAIPFTESPLAINAVVEADQTYVAGSFGNGENIAVAKADEVEMKLPFKNVFGAIAFTLKGSATITRINVYTRGSEVLSGSLQITGIDTAEPVGVVDAEVKEEFMYKSLSCGAGVALNSDPGVTFYISVPAGVFADGFYVEFVDSEGTSMVKSAKASVNNKITRSGITPMPAFSYAPQFKSAFLMDTDAFGAFTNVLASGTTTKPHNYTDGKCQFAFNNTPADPNTGDKGSRSVRFQDWNEGYAISIDIAQNELTLNSTPEVAVKALGNTGDINTKAAKPMKVVKRTTDRVWIVDDTGDGDGYVISLVD